MSGIRPQVSSVQRVVILLATVAGLFALSALFVALAVTA